MHPLTLPKNLDPQAPVGPTAEPESGPDRSGVHGAPLAVLLVEDNPGDARLIKELLFEEAGAAPVTMEHEVRLADGLQSLKDGAFDAVLLDLSFPGESHGLETLVAVQERAPGLPILVLSGLSDEALAIEAVYRGAQDYLVKGDVAPGVLVRSIRYAIERQRLTTEIDESRREQLELKDRFLSHVSHELRSPLSAIYQFVTILLDGLVGDLEVEQHEVAEAILRNTRQLTTMIEDLLEVTRAQTGKLLVQPVWMDLATMLDGVARSYRSMLQGRGIEVITDLSTPLTRVHGDPSRVRQVLANFLDNAAKFTPDGGRITVRAHEDWDDGGFVRIEVSDTGCGIQPGEERRIFERLHQGGAGPSDGRAGLGLGLYICKTLVSRLGGRIGVRSQPREGSTFWFTLPGLSVKDVLAPLFAGDGRPENDSIVLLEVGVARADGSSLTDVDEGPLQRFWEIMERSSLPDLDVLFPRGIADPDHAGYFMAMMADLTGADALIRRVRKQAETLEAFDDETLVATYDCSLIRLDDDSRGHETALDRASSLVRARIDQFLEKGN